MRWTDEPSVLSFVRAITGECESGVLQSIVGYPPVVSDVSWKPKPAGPTKNVSERENTQPSVFLFSQTASLRVSLSLTWRRASTAPKTWRDSPGYSTHLRKHVLFKTRYAVLTCKKSNTCKHLSRLWCQRSEDDNAEVSSVYVRFCLPFPVSWVDVAAVRAPHH